MVIKGESFVRGDYSLYRLVIIAALLLAVCGCGGETTTPEPTSTPMATPRPTLAATSTPDEEPAVEMEGMTEYVSANRVFHIQYPEDWVINEVPVATRVSFAIAPSEDVINQRPDFSQPVAFVFGVINQVNPSVLATNNLEDLHRQALLEGSLFEYEVVGEPTVLQPNSSLTYLLMEATSTEEDGSVVNWRLGTGVADLTVVHFGIGVSEAGMEEYGDIAEAMFNSVMIDTEVTEELAGNE
jgi:hypothetical protein